jgi:dTDP-4-dehydrorhamnose reductase
VHVANAGVASWHDVAATVFALAGQRSLLTPCTTAEYPTPAVRPRHGVLDLSRAAGLGIRLPPWDDAVTRFVETLRAELR